MRTPLQKDEKVLLITYTSWISLIVPFLVAVAGLVAAYFIEDNIWKVVVAAIGILFFLIRYFIWKVDIWVVTSSRVIDESGLLSHFAKESPLEKINNVSYDQTVWGRLLNFGHVEIQTAAEIGATDYFNVSNPKRLKDTITLAQAEFKNIQLTSQAMHLANAMNQTRGNVSSGSSIASELEKLASLREKGILNEVEYEKAKSRLLNG
ncbi:MAG: PH domain-containing protein [Gemmatimonadaceae bacterium]|nr:PH domain-containing protein [Chitinophagaceae bacterium]